MSTPASPNAHSRAELRAYLVTLGGQHFSWPHLALRHNSLAVTTPCRLCDHGVAAPQEGPALFWDDSPLCPACAAEVAPELTLYLAVLQACIHHAGGDWRALRRAA